MIPPEHGQHGKVSGISALFWRSFSNFSVSLWFFERWYRAGATSSAAPAVVTALSPGVGQGCWWGEDVEIGCCSQKTQILSSLTEAAISNHLYLRISY